MAVIVITGGAASGKSTAADCFRALGVTVIDTDQLAREVVAEGSPGLEQVIRHFGARILGPDGALDRRRLRRMVFSDPGRRRQLENILHPLIGELARQRTTAALQAGRQTYVMLEVPLYTETCGETGGYPRVDRVLLIDVPPALQLLRLRKRDGIDREAAQRLLDAQASRAQRLAIADDVIRNSGSRTALQKACRAMHRRYLRLFAGSGATSVS